MMAAPAILGHEGPRSVLARALAAGALPHAWLFHGPEGVGKRTMALAFAAAALCEAPGEGLVPCGACRSCRAGRGGAHPDVVLVTPAGREILVAQVGAVQEEIHRRPVVAHRRVFVFDGVDRMTTEAANRLLKTLEEPPPGTILLLVTARREQVLPTVRSRAHRLRFASLPTGGIERALVARGADPGRARVAATLADGSLARALALLEGGLGFRERVLDLALADGGDGGRAAGLLEFIRETARARGREGDEAESEEGTEATQAAGAVAGKVAGEAVREVAAEALDHLLVLLRDAALIAEGLDVPLRGPDRRGLAERVAARGPEGLRVASERVVQGLDRLRDPRNLAPDLVLEEALGGGPAWSAPPGD